jgi:hypothetical protein
MTRMLGEIEPVAVTEAEPRRDDAHVRRVGRTQSGVVDAMGGGELALALGRHDIGHSARSSAQCAADERHRRRHRRLAGRQPPSRLRSQKVLVRRVENVIAAVRHSVPRAWRRILPLVVRGSAPWGPAITAAGTCPVARPTASFTRRAIASNAAGSSGPP